MFISIFLNLFYLWVCQMGVGKMSKKCQCQKVLAYFEVNATKYNVYILTSSHLMYYKNYKSCAAAQN